MYTYIHEQTLWAECRFCLMLEQEVHIVTTITCGSYSAHGCRFVAITSPNDAKFRQRSVVESETKCQIMFCEVHHVY